jgi:rubredoxin
MISKELERLWSCPICGFAFDAVHLDLTAEGFTSDGQYSCPVCMLEAVRKKLLPIIRSLAQLEKLHERQADDMRTLVEERDEASKGVKRLETELQFYKDQKGR